MRISIVIATYNGAGTIGAQLQAIANQDWEGELEVVVSDNGSSDGTPGLAETYRAVLPGLQVVAAFEQRGVSHARNVGASAAQGEYLLFCDQDDEVADGWLRAMAAALQVAPFVAGRLEHRALNPAWSVRLYGEPQSDGLANTDPPFMPFAWGCTLGVRRELHERVGGFNTAFTQGGEDNDYCYRIQSLGTELTFVPAAVIHYRHRTRAGDTFQQARGYGRESVRLLVNYRSHGMQPPSQGRAFVSWMLLLPHLAIEMLTRHGRARWLVRLGWRIGRLESSVSNRILAL